MALEGTLKDFSLADIFQLIGIQKKTGVLTLDDGRETVTVSFLSGEVVSADSSHKNLEDRLGNVLVKSGRLKESQLRRALALQRETRQRLGFIVVKQGMVGVQDLREALALQVTQIVYRLFRWKAGDYHFAQRASVEYDRDYFTPISAESILMEGIRMIDEWPIIERTIRSFDMVFRKRNPALVPRIATVEFPVDNDFETTLRGAAAEGGADDGEGGLLMAPDEAEVYQLVDGRRTIQDIIDQGRRSEFDTCRALYDLLNRGILATSGVEPSAPAAPRVQRTVSWIGPLLERACYLALLIAAAGSLTTSGHGPLSGSPTMLVPAGSLDRVQELVTRNRIERLDEAIRIYFLQKGFLPDDLRELVRGGLVPATSLSDPAGRSFGFVATSDGYRIVAYEDGGVENPRRSLARTLLRKEELSAPGTPAPRASEASLRR